MPTKRFLQLPEEKRRRIVAAAVDELKRVPYSQLSINQIVRAAGIPRGSFYQYFADKKDLLEYLMRDYRQTLYTAVGQRLEQNGGDVFDMALFALDYTIEFAARPGNVAMYRNIFLGMRCGEENEFSFTKMAPGAVVDEFAAKITLPAPWQGDSPQLLEVVDMLLMLLRQTTLRLFCNEDPPQKVRQGFAQKLEIIKRGVEGGGV